MSKKDAKTISVYSKMKAERIQGKFSKKVSTVIRKKMLITDSFAEQENEGFKNSGVYYVVNEEATKEYAKTK